MELNKNIWTVDEAFAYCAEITNRNYENFPVASLFLPQDKRPYIQSIYAFSRIADDFADEGNVDPSIRLQNLENWEIMLKACYNGTVNHPVFIALRETIIKLSIPIELLSDLLIAFRMDVTKKRYKNFDEVLEYCKYSANPVGRLVLHIFGYDDKELFSLSDHICTALQLTNFYQDITVDLEKNRIYIPEDEMLKFGYSEVQLAKKVYNNEFRNLMELQVERTRDLYYKGSPLPSMVNKDLQLELKLVWFGGMTMIRKVERKKYNVFQKHHKLNLFNKLSIFLRGLFYNDITKYKKKSLWDLT